MLKNLKIGVKLTLLCACLLMIMTIAVTVGLVKLSGMNERIDRIVDVSAEKIKLAARINQDLLAIVRTEKNIILARSATEITENVDEAREIRLDMQERRAKLRELVDDEGRVKLDSFAAKWDEYLQVNEKVRELAESGATERAVALSSGRARQLVGESEKLMRAIVEINEQQLAADKLASDRNYSSARMMMIAILLLGAGLGITVSFIITRLITLPMRKGVAFAKSLSEGDLTQTVDVDQEDEVGMLAKALNVMAENLRNMFTDISSGVETLSSSSTELSAVSEQLTGNAENTSNRASAVAAAAEEMSTNMSSVSAAMEQSSSNVGMVATATEEMTSTVTEIAGNAARAKEISEEAVEKSTQTSAKMKELGEAANRIGKVTEAITEISEQTNLLALNATIEAARAGEAGKGFAVVANEIKELAKQTAEATVDIKNQINGMQSTTSGTITDIEKVGEVINEINEVIATIATAVEQQSAATAEISENIAQASAGIEEVNENVAQSSVASEEITKDINEISTGTEEINQGSQNVNESAAELSRLAEKLDELMKRFKVA